MEKNQCPLDLNNTQDIIQHFRDLINIGPMLDCDYELEMIKLKKKLLVEGYSGERIQHFEHLACFGTIYEAELPPPIKNKGDYWEWLKIAPRCR